MCLQVSPVEVCDPSKVQVFGPALEKSLSVDEPTHFVVDCSDAGPGTVSVVLSVCQLFNKEAVLSQRRPRDAPYISLP